MKAAAVLALLALGFAARIDLDNRRWDIQPPMAWFAGKDKGHEAITRFALEKVTEGKALIVAKTLEDGVIYNDMPGADMRVSGNVVGFGLDFRNAEKGALDTVVARSHFGCNQRWHSQSPVGHALPDGLARRAGNAGAVQKLKEAGVAKLEVAVTNRDMYNMIMDTARIWWKQAVGEAAMFYSCPNGAGKDQNSPCFRKYNRAYWKKIGKESSFMDNKLDLSDAFIGHFSHMVQDSFAMGHAVRDGSKDGCGKFVGFTGYGSQKDNRFHGDMDHDPKITPNTDAALKMRNVARRKVLWNCAISATQDLLTAWGSCKQMIRDTIIDKKPAVPNKCAFPETSVFQKWMEVRPDVAADRAGGSPWISSKIMCPGPDDKLCTLDFNKIPEFLKARPDQTARDIPVDLGKNEILECNPGSVKQGPNGVSCTIRWVESKYNLIRVDDQGILNAADVDKAIGRKADPAAGVISIEYNAMNPDITHPCTGQYGKGKLDAETLVGDNPMALEVSYAADRNEFYKQIIPTPDSSWAGRLADETIHFAKQLLTAQGSVMQGAAQKLAGLY